MAYFPCPSLQSVSTYAGRMQHELAATQQIRAVELSSVLTTAQSTVPWYAAAVAGRGQCCDGLDCPCDVFGAIDHLHLPSQMQISEDDAETVKKAVSDTMEWLDENSDAEQVHASPTLFAAHVLCAFCCTVAPQCQLQLCYTQAITFSAAHH